MLFQLDLAGGEPEELFEAFWSGSAELGPERSPVASRPFAESLVRGVHARRRDLDRIIVGSTRNWKLERMAVVDRCVLRMAIYEMLALPGTPPAVIIDEAIEIAKKFGGEASGSFVNGILDAIRERVASGRIEPWAEREPETPASIRES